LDDLDVASPLLPALPLDDLLPIGGIPSLIGALVVGVVTMDGDGVVFLTGGSVVDGTVGASVEIVSTGDGVGAFVTGTGDGGLIMDRGGVGESDVDPSVGGNVIGALVMGTGGIVGFRDGLGDGSSVLGLTEGAGVGLSVTFATVGLTDGDGGGSIIVVGSSELGLFVVGEDVTGLSDGESVGMDDVTGLSVGSAVTVTGFSLGDSVGTALVGA